VASLGTAFSRRAVTDLADPVSFVRGVAYATAGRVEQVEIGDDDVVATVRGAIPYQVRLTAAGGHPAWSCSCPAAEDGSFCKHCVAAALSLEESTLEELFDPFDDEEQASAHPDGLAPYLETLTHERLVAIVVEQAATDWRLRERLLAEAAAASGDEVDVAAWSRRLDDVFDTGDFVAYAEASAWAADVDDVLDGLADLLEEGHAGAVVTLTERAHRLADAAIGRIDDSDGQLTDLSERIGELHLAACRASRPDAVALARRLVDLELTSELDAFHRAALRYGEVLGDAGLAEYRRLVRPRFDRLPAQGAHSERFRVVNALEGVALAARDPDELIAVKARDLRLPDDYAEVASLLADVGRVDEAVDWARRGLAAFSTRTWQTGPLREVLADLHRGRGESADAVALFWDAFASAPAVQSYRRLVAEADAAGGGEAAGELAVASLRARLSDTPDAQRPDVASALVEILLYEGRADDAWQVATEQGCDQPLWMTLARAREATHPLDAVGVYEQEALELIARAKSQLYPHAVKLADRIRKLSATGGAPERFESFVARLRTEHGRKRSLMALLDRKGW
jgi:uncharacterized Zn finger protein